MNVPVALKWRSFDRTIDEVRAKFEDRPTAELEALIDEAVAAARQCRVPKPSSR
nr:ribbon-helix-helix domain-containing protein [Polymorphobacter multimanifer]